MIERLLSLYRLKEEPRTGWLERGIADAESVADHSWGTALLCLIYGEAAGVDAGRAIRLALVHDLAEAVTGDRPARFDSGGRMLPDPEKKPGELLAIERLFPAESGELAPLRALWSEYEERESPEAAFVRDMNLLDMCLQALIYETTRAERETAASAAPARNHLEEFFESSERRISTGVGRELFGQAWDQYRAIHGGASEADSEPK